MSKRYSQSSGCVLDSVGHVIGIVVSFLVTLVMFAVTVDFRASVNAGSILSIVGFGMVAAGWLLNELPFLYVCANASFLLAFPVAMYSWSSGSTHGFAWLWIIFWLCAAGGGLHVLLWLAEKLKEKWGT